MNCRVLELEWCFLAGDRYVFWRKGEGEGEVYKIGL